MTAGARAHAGLLAVGLTGVACGAVGGSRASEPVVRRPASDLACAHPVTTPIDTDFHLVFFQMTVAGRPLWFLLDSGSDDSLLDAGKAASLGLHPSAPERVPQPGGEIEIGRIDQVSLAVGDAAWTMPIQTAPIAPLARFVGRTVDGVIGHDVISRFAIELDYDARRMTLCDAATARYVGHGVRIPLEIGPTAIDRVAALAEATLITVDHREVTGKFTLDTGGMATVGLAANFARDAGLPVASQPMLPDPGIALGGSTAGKTFRIESLRLGGEVLHDLPISVTTSGAFADRPYAGTIAGEVLSRFRVVLDDSRSVMYLTPGPDVAMRFPYDAAGMLATSVPGSDRIEIAMVIDGAPAAAAGLRAGDVILAVDGRPLRRLHELWTLTRTAGRHAIRYEREGATRSAEIVLRERI